MNKINIEIMPVDKSCEQGCPQCPLAKREGIITSPRINAQVQNSLGLLEGVLKKEGKHYDLHFTSQIELFPDIIYPELIDMARFETNKYLIREQIPKYSDDIKNTLTQRNIKPDHLCFSVVPKSPLLNEIESQTIKELFGELSQWFLSEERSRKVSCTIRSNFIPKSKLDLISTDLKKSDYGILNTILDGIFEKQYRSKGNFELEEFENMECYRYLSKLKRIIKGREFEISNRAISHKSKSQRMDELLQKHPHIKNEGGSFERHQAIEKLVLHKKINPSILIDPSGIMFNHTSLAINNPILRISHKDFAKMLEENTHRPLKKRVENTIKTNLYMYDYLKQEDPENFDKGTKKDYLSFFEEIREKFKS